jgi:hypothetical protein
LVTRVFVVAVLFPERGSGSTAVTVAVLLICPVTVGRMTIVAVADAFLAKPLRLQLTVAPDWEQLPWLAVAETNATPLGSVSVSVTPVADAGPPFLTVRVYVRFCPSLGRVGELRAVTDKSAVGVGTVTFRFTLDVWLKPPLVPTT